MILYLKMLEGYNNKKILILKWNLSKKLFFMNKYMIFIKKNLKTNFFFRREIKPRKYYLFEKLYNEFYLNGFFKTSSRPR